MTMALTPFPCDSSREHTHQSVSLFDVATEPCHVLHEYDMKNFFYIGDPD